MKQGLCSKKFDQKKNDVRDKNKVREKPPSNMYVDFLVFMESKGKESYQFEMVLS